MKKGRTTEDAIECYMRAIESGQDTNLTKPERQSGIYRFYKGIYLLGDGDWQKGYERLAKLEAERREQELKDNPAFRQLYIMQKSDNPVHRMLVKFISQNGLKLPLKDAKELQDKLLQQEYDKSEKQLPASVDPGAAHVGAVIQEPSKPKGKYDDLCVNWVTRPEIPHQKVEEFLSEQAPELTRRTFYRVILSDAYKRELISKKGRTYIPKE